jgi:hypothetical protein
MRRRDEFKRFDIKTRNKIRSLLSIKDEYVINQLSSLRGKLGEAQSEALEAILSNPTLIKAAKKAKPFPKKPPFSDSLYVSRETDLQDMLASIEVNTKTHIERLKKLGDALQRIDALYVNKKIDSCCDVIVETIETYGWSHALLRRIILIRESLPEDTVNDRIEDLVILAGIKGVVVSSLIHTYAPDQSILLIKKSILNIADRGLVNRYTRVLSKLSVQPFASSVQDLASFLREVMNCSLIDAIILLKFNIHFFEIGDFPSIAEVALELGKPELFESILRTYDASSSDGESLFYKQSSVWLEYEPIRQYRILIDNYYDASREQTEGLPPELHRALQSLVGTTGLPNLVSGKQFTKHDYPALATLEIAGKTSRSALFNYWLTESEGQIGFEKDDLLTLMGLTTDLPRTVPIKPTRIAAKLAKDELVKLILLLLLAKRSKNELDSFHLRKLFEDIAFKNHDGCLVKLVEFHEKSHPAVAEYIYDIATEDFLAKLSKIAPDRADIPEIRASLHEWMARFTGDEVYLQRARAVRIDHQINKVRNEIDDHRIYVDPSRFGSWIEDEMMMEISGALTSTGAGKKGVSVTCDEAVISLVMSQCYHAFCSNSVFGIASYIGRRIRHGTFHGHLYSHVINSIERAEKFKSLFANTQFISKWSTWKDKYNNDIERIISDRLHVYSKSKPNGLLTPDVNTSSKQDILASAVASISKNYTETMSTADITQDITEYCWRLAELDLRNIIRYLKAQQTPLKNKKFLEEELVPAAALIDPRLADTFRRDLELSIDRKLSTMFGWFKRPSIVAPKASVAMLFAATVAEVKDTITDFDPQEGDSSAEDIELVGNFYHLVYDSLAIVVGNAAKYADRSKPLKRNFQIVPGKTKRLIVEICSSIKPTDNPSTVSANIETRKEADYQDANMYDKKSGISKLLLLASNRQDFELDQYAVIDGEVQVRLIYALEH